LAKVEQVSRESGYLNDIPHVQSVERIISGESGDSSLKAIVATKSWGSAEVVLWKV